MNENGGNDSENQKLLSTSPVTAFTNISYTNFLVIKPQTKALFISRLHTSTCITIDNIISWKKWRKELTHTLSKLKVTATSWNMK